MRSGFPREVRKVRTPQGRMLANGQAGRPDDQWNRKTPPMTREGTGNGEMAR